jgi:hypothetical protein
MKGEKYYLYKSRFQNPKATLLSKEEKDRFKLTTHDIFISLSGNEKADIELAFNLIQPERMDGEKIKLALAVLGGNLKEGGYLVVGYEVPLKRDSLEFRPTFYRPQGDDKILKYQIYRRQGNIIKEVERYAGGAELSSKEAPSELVVIEDSFISPKGIMTPLSWKIDKEIDIEHPKFKEYFLRLLEGKLIGESHQSINTLKKVFKTIEKSIQFIRALSRSFSKIREVEKVDDELADNIRRIWEAYKTSKNRQGRIIGKVFFNKLQQFEDKRDIVAVSLWFEAFTKSMNEKEIQEHISLILKDYSDEAVKIMIEKVININTQFLAKKQKLEPPTASGAIDVKKLQTKEEKKKRFPEILSDITSWIRNFSGRFFTFPAAMVITANEGTNFDTIVAEAIGPKRAMSLEDIFREAISAISGRAEEGVIIDDLNKFRHIIEAK